MNKVQVLILGGSGYGGGELLRLLVRHPQVGSIRAVSRARAGEPFGAVHPNLRGVVDGRFEAEPDWAALAAAHHPVVFSALPHFELARRLPGLERKWAELGLAERLLLIDLSGDFRLDDPAAFEDAYGRPHPCPERLGSFVYGLPEWQREAIAGARRIANPGCFATAVQLALLPLAGVPDLGFVAVSAATGSSGSGALPGAATHHPTRANDFRAYKVLAHQHEAEIRRLLVSGGGGSTLAFVPHSAPFVRGIFATVQLCPAPAAALTADALVARFRKYYEAAPFVRLVEDSPRVAAVAGSNFCDVAVYARGTSVAVLAALDNLGKGMAGQAVQNLNLACGWPEASGLDWAGAYPA